MPFPADCWQDASRRLRSCSAILRQASHELHYALVRSQLLRGFASQIHEASYPQATRLPWILQEVNAEVVLSALSFGSVEEFRRMYHGNWRRVQNFHENIKRSRHGCLVIAVALSLKGCSVLRNHKTSAKTDFVDCG